MKKTRLKIVCAWCNKTIGYKDGKGVNGITHGICRKCQKKHFGKQRKRSRRIK